MEDKLKLTDKLSAIVIKMSEGNPGAISVIMQLYDICNPMEFITYMLLLDSKRVYADRLYMLCNDSCNGDMARFRNLLDNIINGKITQKDIDERVTKGYGKSFDDLIMGE